MEVILTLLTLAGLYLLYRCLRKFNEYLGVRFNSNLFEPKILIPIGIAEVLGILVLSLKEEIGNDNAIVLAVISLTLAVMALIISASITNLFYGLLVYLIDIVIAAGFIIVIVYLVSAIASLFDKNNHSSNA